MSIVACKIFTFDWQFPLGRNEDESVKFFENEYKKGGLNSSYFDSYS